MYDAVHLFAKALHDLDTSQQIDIKPLSCESTDTWPHGYSLINYMKIVSIEAVRVVIACDWGLNSFISHELHFRKIRVRILTKVFGDRICAYSKILELTYDALSCEKAKNS